MKYFLIFLVICVAMASGAPQFITTFPGYTGVVPARTLVAGPTVVNGFGAPYIAPGYVGPVFY